MNKVRRFTLLLGILCAVILIGYSFVSIETFTLKRSGMIVKTSNTKHKPTHKPTNLPIKH